VLRRLTDIIISLTALVILSPLLILLIITNLFATRGRPFFIQERVGRNGRLFNMLKLRTMNPGSDLAGQITIGHDSRVTQMGQFLRRYKFDELPQLVNVVVGQMSLVGPRPEVPKYVAMYSEEQRAILSIRPGLTDPASLRFIDEGALLSTFADPERSYIEHIMPEKLRINMTYHQKRTWSSDMSVLWQTVVGSLFRTRPQSRE